MTGRSDVDEPQQIKSNDCLRTTTAAPDKSTRGKRDTGIGTGLLGEPNEAMVSVGGKMFPALLDTGSTASTISQDGFDFLDEQVLNPIEDVLRIECADGQLLPYLGYIEVAVDVPGCEGETENVLLLVVPNTPYNTNVPVLLGTNVLKLMRTRCQKKNASKHKSDIVPAWKLAFQCISLQQKELTRREGCLAQVKCAISRGIYVAKNETVKIPCFISKSMKIADCWAMAHPAANSHLPEGVEVAPSLICYRMTNTCVPIKITNFSGSTIRVVCELQHAEVECLSG